MIDYYLPFKSSDYMEPVIGEWTCTELWWSDIDKDRLKYSDGTLFQGQFVHLKCHMDWHGSESELLQRADGALPSEKWHDSIFSEKRNYSTGRFIMFSVITNIYKKRTIGPTLMELFTAKGKLKRFFWQLEIFDVCLVTHGAHIENL